MPSYNSKLFRNANHERITSQSEAIELYQKLSTLRSEARKIKLIEKYIDRAVDREREWVGVATWLEQQ